MCSRAFPFLFTFKCQNRYICKRNHQLCMNLNRITFDPNVMGGKPCIRGMRVTVGTIVGLIAAGRSNDEIIGAYPYLEMEDLRQALSYAAWRAEEVDIPVVFS